MLCCWKLACHEFSEAAPTEADTVCNVLILYPAALTIAVQFCYIVEYCLYPDIEILRGMITPHLMTDCMPKVILF